VNILLKILRIVLPIIVFVLAGYSSISGNYEVMPYMLLVMGINEIKKERKKMGIFSIIVSVFVFYVSVQGLLLK